MLGGLRRLVQVIRSKDRVSLVLLSFPILYLLIMGASRHYFARYALPLVPFAALIRSGSACRPWRPGRGRGTQGLRYVLMTLLVVVAIAPPLAQSITHDIDSDPAGHVHSGQELDRGEHPRRVEDRCRLADSWATSVDIGKADARSPLRCLMW